MHLMQIGKEDGVGISQVALSYASGPFSVELSHTTAEGGLMGQKATLDETAKYGIPESHYTNDAFTVSYTLSDCMTITAGMSSEKLDSEPTTTNTTDNATALTSAAEIKGERAFGSFKLSF